RMQSLEADTVLGQDAGGPILDEDIGTAHKIAQQLGAFGPLEVEADAAFAAVFVEKDRTLPLGQAVIAHHVTARSELELDYFGTEIRHQLAGQRPGNVLREVEDAETGKDSTLRRISHRLFSSEAEVSHAV